MFDTAAPTGTLPWLGVGHEYSSTTGRSLPLHWSFDATEQLLFDYLPLPDYATGGNTFDVAVAFDSQVAVGHALENDRRQAATWQRSTVNDWRLNDNIALGLIGEHKGDSSITEIAASSSMLIAVLTHEPSTDESHQYPITSSDAVSWELINLPGTNADNWEFGMHVDGANALIIAKQTDEDEPASKIFTTTDAGATWDASDVTLPNNRPVELFDAILDGNAWFAVGSMTTDDDRQEPVTFSFVDQAWEVNTVSFKFLVIPAIEDGSFVAVARLDPEELVAIVDTDPGSRTFTSTDGSEWTLAPKQWLNRSDRVPRTADFRAMADGPATDRILVARGFEVPVWLSSEDTEKADDSAFDHITRMIDGVAAENSDFFVFTHRIGIEFSGTDVWKTSAGDTWELFLTFADVIPTRIADVSDAIIIDGTDSTDDRFIRIAGGSEIELDISDLISIDASVTSFLTSRPMTVPTAGRNLLAVEVRTDVQDSVQIAFVDVSEPAEVSIEIVPDSSQNTVKAVCPQLSSGETTVVLGRRDQPGTRIVVMADRAQRFVGAGEFAGDTASFDNAVVTDCFEMTDNLFMIGATCSDESVDEGAFILDECQGQAWVSDTGLSWTEHPLSQVLTDANHSFMANGATIGSGVMFANVRNESEPAALWFATKDDLFQVPTSGLFSLNRFGVDQIIAAQDQLLVRSDSDIFLADLDEVLRQTFPTNAQFEGWQLATQEPVATADPPASTPPPSSTPVPSTQTSSPTPAPVSTPAPVPSQAQPPTCNPGDLTTTGACVCSGGRLFDSGGQCIMRCLSNEDPDGFGGCIRRDGSQVEPQPLATVGSTIEVPVDN